MESFRRILTRLRGDSLDQDEETVAAQNPHRHIRVNGKGDLSWDLQNPLQAITGKIDQSRRIEMIEDLVTDVLQRAQRGVLREVMKVGVEVAALQNAFLSPNGLSRQIERNVEHRVTALVSDVSQKAEIVFQVLDHVEDQDEVEVDVLFLEDVGELVIDSLARSRSSHGERLGRNFVSHESAVAVQVIVELFEDLSGAASGVADRLRPEIVSPQHADDLFGFPGGLLDVPVGILPEIFAVAVDVGVGH